MKFTPQEIPDIILVEPNLHGDVRGYFAETFRQDLFNAAVGSIVNFVHLLIVLNAEIKPEFSRRVDRTIEVIFAKFVIGNFTSNKCLAEAKPR